MSEEEAGKIPTQIDVVLRIESVAEEMEGLAQELEDIRVDLLKRIKELEAAIKAVIDDIESGDDTSAYAILKNALKGGE